MSGTGDREIAPNARIAIHTHSYPNDNNPYSYNTILYEREKEFYQEYSDIPADWVNRVERFFYLSPEQAITFNVADEIYK